jgi:16S rRNA G966 N2-methylase RsmD
LKKLIIDLEFKDLIPPLQPDEREQLERNILAEGCRDPLSVWDGVLIDGHNRYEICTKHGIGFDIHQVVFEDRSHAIEWIIRNQFGRRNLAAFDRVNLCERLDEVLKARGKKLMSECGKKGGRGNKLEKGSEESPNPLDRREEVASAAKVSSNTVSKVKRINQAAKEGKVSQEVIQKIRTGDTSINRVVRDLKEAATKERIEVIKAEAVAKLKQVDEIHLGDFREIGDRIPDNSVDLIFTDPPYDRAAIKLFDGLGEFANRVLRPGGSLVFYLGQIQLPEAIRILSTHLRYWWCCSCYHSGTTLLRMNEYGIVNGWKPMLWFVKETRGDKETFINDVATGTKEKSHHEWQQSESEALYFIEKLTKPGDLVVDPFCGGGTTPAVCEKVNRKWLAFEIDSANYARSCKRIISLRGV